MTKVSVRGAVAAAIQTEAAANPNVYIVTTDSRGSAMVTGLADLFPERFIECGIAEQNAVGVASGLASTGKTVFVLSPACFLSARSYDQVKIDVAYNESDVKLIGVSAGVSYGPLGGTHTTLNDFASMRALPNLEIYAPADAVQAAAITKHIAQDGKPVWLRIGRGDVEAVYEDGESFDIERAKVVCDGSDITLIACGEMVLYAKKAAGLLAEAGIAARVLDMFRLKPVDAAAVIQASYDTEAILTIEEHSIHGGLGEMVAGILAQNHCVPLKIMGFPDEEYKVGSSQELFEHYGLTAENIAREAGALLERARL